MYYKIIEVDFSLNSKEIVKLKCFSFFVKFHERQTNKKYVKLVTFDGAVFLVANGGMYKISNHLGLLIELEVVEVKIEDVDKALQLI